MAQSDSGLRTDSTDSSGTLAPALIAAAAAAASAAAAAANPNHDPRDLEPPVRRSFRERREVQRIDLDAGVPVERVRRRGYRQALQAARPAAPSAEALLALEQRSQRRCREFKPMIVCELHREGNDLPRAAGGQAPRLREHQANIREKAKRVVINAKINLVQAIRPAVDRGATNEELLEITKAVWSQNRRAYANIVMAAGKSLNISILASVFSHLWRDLGDSVPPCVCEALKTKARIVLMVNSKQGKKELQKEGLHEVLGLNDWRYAKEAGVPKAEDTALSKRALFKREWLVEQAKHIYQLDGGEQFDRARWADAWIVITTQTKFWGLARDFNEQGQPCACQIGDDEVDLFIIDEAHIGGAPEPSMTREEIAQGLEGTAGSWAHIQRKFWKSFFFNYTGTPKRWMTGDPNNRDRITGQPAPIPALPLLGECTLADMLDTNELSTLSIIVLKAKSFAWHPLEGEVDFASLDEAGRDYCRRHPKWWKLIASFVVKGMLEDAHGRGVPVQAQLFPPCALQGNNDVPGQTVIEHMHRTVAELLEEGCAGLFESRPVCPVEGTPLTLDFVSGSVGVRQTDAQQKEKIRHYVRGDRDKGIKPTSIMISDQIMRTGVDNPRTCWLVDFHDHVGDDGSLFKQTIGRLLRKYSESNYYVKKDAEAGHYLEGLRRYEATHGVGRDMQPQVGHLVIPQFNPNCIEHVRSFLREQKIEHMVNVEEFDLSELEAELAAIAELQVDHDEVMQLAEAERPLGPAAGGGGSHDGDMDSQAGEDSDARSISSGVEAEAEAEASRQEAARVAMDAVAHNNAERQRVREQQAQADQWEQQNLEQIGRFVAAPTEVVATLEDAEAGGEAGSEGVGEAGGALRRAIRVTHGFGFADAEVQHTLWRSMQSSGNGGDGNDEWEQIATASANANGTLEVTLCMAAGGAPRRLQWRAQRPGLDSFPATPVSVRGLNRGWRAAAQARGISQDDLDAASSVGGGTERTSRTSAAAASGGSRIAHWAPLVAPTSAQLEAARTFADRCALIEETMSWIYCPILRAIGGVMRDDLPRMALRNGRELQPPPDHVLLTMLAQLDTPQDPESSGCFGPALTQLIQLYQQDLRVAGGELGRVVAGELPQLCAEEAARCNLPSRWPYVYSAEALALAVRPDVSPRYAEPTQIDER